MIHHERGEGEHNPCGTQKETQNPNSTNKNLQLHHDTNRKLSTMVPKGVSLEWTSRVAKNKKTLKKQAKSTRVLKNGHYVIGF